MSLKLRSWQVKYYMEFSVYRDEAKQWRWRLKHANGQIMADSGEGYKRKATCLRAVKNIKECLSNAKVKVLDARDGRWRTL